MTQAQIENRLKVVKGRLEGKNLREIARENNFTVGYVHIVKKQFELPADIEKKLQKLSKSQQDISGISDEQILDIAKQKLYGEDEDWIADKLGITVEKVYLCYKRISGERPHAYKKSAGRVVFYPALEDYRKEKNLSVATLSGLLNISSTELDQILTGTRFMSKDVAERVQRVTKIPIDKLILPIYKLDPDGLSQLEAEIEKYDLKNREQ